MVYYDSSYDASRGLAIGAIVAIVLSVLFFFVVVPIAGCIVWRKRKGRMAARNKAAQDAIIAQQQQYQMNTYGQAPVYGQPQQQQQAGVAQQYGGYYAAPMETKPADGGPISPPPPAQQPYQLQ